MSFLDSGFFKSLTAFWLLYLQAVLLDIGVKNKKALQEQEYWVFSILCGNYKYFWTWATLQIINRYFWVIFVRRHTTPKSSKKIEITTKRFNIKILLITKLNINLNCCRCCKNGKGSWWFRVGNTIGQCRWGWRNVNSKCYYGDWSCYSLLFYIGLLLGYLV